MGEPFFGGRYGTPEPFVKGEGLVTAYSIVIGVLLAFPWALVGTVFLGAAVSAVGRWLKRHRGVHRAPGFGWSTRARPKGGEQERPMSIPSAIGSAASHHPRPLRKAA